MKWAGVLDGQRSREKARLVGRAMLKKTISERHELLSTDTLRLERRMQVSNQRRLSTRQQATQNRNQAPVF
jgi:hypothetical protein